MGPDLQIKICDLAIICAAFKDDYGEVRGRKSLPIRWIAWETIVMVNILIYKKKFVRNYDDDKTLIFKLNRTNSLTAALSGYANKKSTLPLSLI